MQLHRTSQKPDWQKVPVAERNYWQCWAAATHGYGTLANGITLIGFGIVLGGLGAIITHHYWLGANSLAVGRFLDIVDGVVADKTGTKSPLGESLDAGFDKLGTFLTIGVMLVVATASRWLLLSLVTPQIITGLLFLTHSRFHPSQAGKLSMFFAWIGLVGLVVVKAMPHIEWFRLLVFSTVIVSIVLGTYAVIGYIQEAKTR